MVYQAARARGRVLRTFVFAREDELFVRDAGTLTKRNKKTGASSRSSFERRAKGALIRAHAPPASKP